MLLIGFAGVLLRGVPSQSKIKSGSRSSDCINAAVPRHLSRDHRDDVIADMVLAIYEGELEEVEISRRVREFVYAGYRRDHDQHGPQTGVRLTYGGLSGPLQTRAA